jgi:hypothetical protein
MRRSTINPLSPSTTKGLAVIVLVLSAVATLPCFAAPSTNKVLFLSTTLTRGLTGPGNAYSYEEAAVLAAGLVTEVVTPAVWSAMTAAQFGTYRAIVLGDNTCTDSSAYAAPIANANVWLPQISAAVLSTGTDPVYHTRFTNPAINQLTINSINLAIADPTRVGGYLCLSCAWNGVGSFTPLPLLSPWGTFTVRGVGCWNNA